jgi:menaquinone-dependent protoporphyrinogen IX oxidase
MRREDGDILKALVVFDSVFGNTEKVARAVGRALESGGQVEVRLVADVRPEQLAGVGLLVVGSPTRAFRPTPTVAAFVRSLPKESLVGVRVAAFDTRFPLQEIKQGFVRLMARLFGYAAPRIASALVKRGGELAAPPEGFAVKESEGPLGDGELERAAVWARGLSG